MPDYVHHYHVKLVGDGLFRGEADNIMAAFATSPVGVAHARNSRDKCGHDRRP